MAINKVIYRGEVVVDLTPSEVTEIDVAKGKKFIGADGELKVGTFEAPAMEPNLQEKEAIENGEIVADEGYDGLSKVVVNVQAPDPIVEKLEVTENGTYQPSNRQVIEMTYDGHPDGFIHDLNEFAWVATDFVVPQSFEELESFWTDRTINIILPDGYNGEDGRGAITFGDSMEDEGILRVNFEANGLPAIIIFYTSEALENNNFPGETNVVYVSNGLLLTEVIDDPEAKITYDGLVKNPAVGFNEVVVSVQPKLQSKTASTNKTTITADEGFDGLSEVVIEVPDPVLQEKSVTQNGDVTADEGFDGLSKVTVKVEPSLQSKTVRDNGRVTADDGFYGLSEVIVEVETSGAADPILQEKSTTENGEITPDEGFDGLSKVIVDVQPNLQSKTITTNGTITADDGFDGLSEVIVQVEGGSGEGGYAKGIIEVATAKEMRNILQNATIDDIGNVYKYLGPTTEDFENGAIYEIYDEPEILQITAEDYSTEELPSGGEVLTINTEDYTIELA